MIDPADPDRATLEAALRLARLLAIASLRDVGAEIDVEAIRAALAASAPSSTRSRASRRR